MFAGHLKGRLGVVIESRTRFGLSVYGTFSAFSIDSNSSKWVRHPSQRCSGNSRRAPAQFAATRHLTIEDAERIRIITPLTVRAVLTPLITEKVEQCLTIRRTAFSASIEFSSKYSTTRPIASRRFHEQADDLGIHRRGCHANASALPGRMAKASLLRPLVRNIGTGVKVFLGRGKCMEILLDIASYDRCGTFRPHADAAVALVGKV